jgi:TonB family protein
MRLDPTHKPLVGVNGASLVSVPVIILLFVLSLKFGPPPGRGAAQPRPEPKRAAAQIVAEAPPVTKPAVDARTSTEHRQQPVVEPRKPTIGRVVYSVRWSGAENRRKVAGNVPQYPAGVTVESMARLELVVTGTGVVRSAKVLQAGNPECDDAALREIRQWKFEPLARQNGRVDQRCIVLVSFMRK